MKTRIYLTMVIFQAMVVFSIIACSPPPANHGSTPVDYSVKKDRGPGSVPFTDKKDWQNLDTIKKDAALGVFCPPKMKLYETRLITVWIKVNRTTAQIKRDLILLETESNDWKSSNDSTAIIPISLQLYDSVKVFIKYDTADFLIMPVLGNDGKNTKIDVKKGNLWQWTIKAISVNKRSSKITLLVEPHTPPNLDLQPIPAHVIPITIYFDFWDMIRGWIRYLGEHPEYTIPSVLIPIIVVIYKRRKKKKS